MSERNPDHRTPEDVVLKVVDMLRTSEFTKVTFRTDMDQRVEPLKPVDRDGKVSVGITTNIGNRRTERWTLDKISQYMRAGFWFAKLDGVVHDGGYAQAKQAEREESDRAIGSFMERMSLHNLFVDSLEAAGLAGEAKALRRGSIEGFDMRSAKAFLVEAIRAAGPDVLDRFTMPKEEPAPEEEAGFRPR
jgi:hypothetical protein